jgi:hypothetical protein
MQIFGHFYQFVWAHLWTLGQNRGQNFHFFDGTC